MADTQEIILNRMLGNISSEYDTSKGSFFYDTLKPVAIEDEKIYVITDGILDKRFADTATGKDLDRIVKDFGLYRKITTKSFGVVTITGLKGAIIKKGEKVASDNVNFIFTEDKIISESNTIDVKIECEKYGTVGNVPIGAIKYFPKTLSGLQTVTNKEAINNGYDEETDESLRERYYIKVRTPSTSGNIYHYMNWSREVLGVGDSRIIPLWNGNGTVKVVIINSNKTGAEDTLVKNVAEHIEEVRPIGATVTVVSAAEKSIYIFVTLNIDSTNNTLSQIIANIENAIKEYLKSIAFKQNYVSYAKVGSLILETEGVIDYSNLKINDGIVNIPLEDTDVAILGGVAANG